LSARRGRRSAGPVTGAQIRGGFEFLDKATYPEPWLTRWKTAIAVLVVHNAGELSRGLWIRPVAAQCDRRDARAHSARSNPRLNAIITLDEAGAINAAEASARRWKDGHPLGALEWPSRHDQGQHLAAGLRATWGSRLYEHFVPDEDELAGTCGCAKRARSFSARPTCRSSRSTVLPTMRCRGRQALPGDPALTPGGSSGGEVAAVASGRARWRSARWRRLNPAPPAAHTGLIGFKPSRDTVRRGKGLSRDPARF